MDNRAIGVFDSGLGGLTAVRRLQEIMPQEPESSYFGDTGRVPYGTRGRDIYHQIRAAGCCFPPAVRPEGDHRRLQYGFFRLRSTCSARKTISQSSARSSLRAAARCGKQKTGASV